eukprot:jgi/Tetstr1/424773/TSEL_015290.t1
MSPEAPERVKDEGRACSGDDDKCGKPEGAEQEGQDPRQADIFDHCESNELLGAANGVVEDELHWTLPGSSLAELDPNHPEIPLAGELERMDSLEMDGYQRFPRGPMTMTHCAK